RDRYRKSYEDHGYGLYCVELKDDGTLIGLCGFVRRDTLPGPDIGFAFLPEFEGLGFGFESAKAMMNYGRECLGFSEVFAITTLDNEASGRLLEKIGFTFEKTIDTAEGETLKLFRAQM
ncbi:MAG: GNAT family N-acetyltransferase, partial [Pyrinomonadaceae bacterium]